MKILNYTIIYNAEPEGGFTVTVPSLPGCVTYGGNLEEAKKMAKDAIGLYLESLQKHKEPIPTEDNSFISSVNLTFPQAHA
ncbi:type II toxin-antitoxin system HicB family antitoxin [Candidatus Microgenomates bacterium]|nr:type II toxin-antitoxin system HicB family antitoxin [Candidatus Microgenomates bacterium]